MASLMDILAGAGNLLDLPGSSLRDILSGRNPFDQWATPFSDVNRASGRDVLQPFLGANEETGMAGWATNPMEGLKDIAGFGAEMLLDPLNLVPLGAVGKALKGRKAARQTNAAMKAERGGKYALVNPKVLAEKIPETVRPQARLGYSGPALKTLEYDDLAKYNPMYQTNTWVDRNASGALDSSLVTPDDVPYPNTYLVKATHYPSASSTYRSMNPEAYVGDNVTMPMFGAYSGLNPGHAAYRAAANNMDETLGRIEVLRQMQPSTAEGLEIVTRQDELGLNRYRLARKMNNMWNEASDMYAVPHRQNVVPTDVWNEIAQGGSPVRQAGHAGPFVRSDNLIPANPMQLQPEPSPFPAAVAGAVYNALQAFNGRGGIQ